MKLREWPVPVIVVAILVTAAVGYTLSAWASGAWQSGVNLIGGTLMTVLGVTLVERLRMRGSDE